MALVAATVKRAGLIARPVSAPLTANALPFAIRAVRPRRLTVTDEGPGVAPGSGRRGGVRGRVGVGVGDGGGGGVV